MPLVAALASWPAAGTRRPADAPPPTAGPVDAARAALRAGQFDAAIADADDYLRGQPAGPRAAEADYAKGSAYQRKPAASPGRAAANLFEAHTAYLAALNARPPSELEGYVRAGLSTVALFQDDFPSAIEQAQRATPLVSDPPTQAWLLYNTAVAQQRLGRFTDADQTFRQVVQRYPGTPQAVAAQQHEGQRLFYVQLAIYPTAADADRATPSLRSNGSVVSRRSDATGHTVLDARPVQHLRLGQAAAGRRRRRLPGRPDPAVTTGSGRYRRTGRAQGSAVACTLAAPRGVARRASDCRPAPPADPRGGRRRKVGRVPPIRPADTADPDVSRAANPAGHARRADRQQLRGWSVKTG